jgi:hypothetical protein
MVRSELSPAVTSVAVAAPLESVTAGEPETPPDDAVNVTGTPAISVLEVSRTNAVIVALADPSEGIVAVLVVAVTTAAATEPPPPVPVPVPPLPVAPGANALPSGSLPPPQAASSSVANTDRIRDLRMLVT